MEAIVYPAATASAAAATVDAQSGVSWAAVAAGAVAAAALTLLLVAFGAGIGFSSISPWSDTGVSGSTFAVGTGIYLVIVAVMSSAVGGYLAGRLRTKWVGVHTSEVFFRDTAHGFLAWAFATLLSATILTASTAYVANGVAAGAGGAAAQAARSINPAEVYVDKLLRPAPGSMQAAAPASAEPNAAAANTATTPASAGAPGGATNPNQARSEILRLWTADFAKDQDLNPSDKAYVAQVVAARTGLSPADAEKRVNEVVTEAKAATDKARRGAAKLSFWLTAAMLFGAFAASLAAAEGGALRDGTWNERVLTRISRGQSHSPLAAWRSHPDHHPAGAVLAVRNRRSLTGEAARHRTVVTARPRQRNPNDAVYCMPSDETVTFTVPSASAMTRSALSS